MGDEHTGLSRRRLLKLGAAGVALASSEKVLPQLALKTAEVSAKPVVVWNPRWS